MDDVVSLQSLANDMLAQALTSGQITLSNGRVVKLKDSDMLRLLALVKSSKVSHGSATGEASLIPEDFIIPTIVDQPQTLSEPSSTPQQPEVQRRIDFDELERQINKNLYGKGDGQ